MNKLKKKFVQTTNKYLHTLQMRSKTETHIFKVSKQFNNNTMVQLRNKIFRSFLEISPKQDLTSVRTYQV